MNTFKILRYVFLREDNVDMQLNYLIDISRHNDVDIGLCTDQLCQLARSLICHHVIRTSHVDIILLAALVSRILIFILHLTCILLETSVSG